MFFADPLAAFTSIARALRPRGGWFWTSLEQREWVVALREALSLGPTLPTPRPGAPGPWGAADRPFAQACPWQTPGSWRSALARAHSGSVAGMPPTTPLHPLRLRAGGDVLEEA